MEKKARILFISLTLLALISSALYHNLLSPPKTNLTLDGPNEVARVAYDLGWKQKFGGERVGWITYYVEKHKLYKKMGKFGKYFRKRKKSR